MHVNTLENLADKGLLAGKRVLIRSDLNVPRNDEGAITNDARIEASLPAIRMALAAGAAVMVTSHLGRPKEGQLLPADSLQVVADRIGELLGREVPLVKNWVDGVDVKPGDLVILENCRCNVGEKKCDEALSKKYAALCDVYVNDAFGTAHRKHASTYLIAKYFPQDKMFGYLMEKEVKAIAAVMEKPAHPFCAIIGGSKVSSKIGVIKALIEKVDSIIIGGGMTYTFAAAQGGKVGDSICEPDMFPVALEILELAKQKGVQLVMSPDALIADAFSADANTDVAPADNIPDGWEGVDIADEGKKAFREHILGCKTILWNGPVGVFEIDKFATGSKEVALAIAEATKKGAYSLIGGGDSVACINKFGLADQVSYISTGGGALLEYIEFGDLPGVAAIRD